MSLFLLVRDHVRALASSRASLGLIWDRAYQA